MRRSAQVPTGTPAGQRSRRNLVSVAFATGALLILACLISLLAVGTATGRFAVLTSSDTGMPAPAASSATGAPAETPSVPPRAPPAVNDVTVAVTPTAAARLNSVVTPTATATAQAPWGDVRRQLRIFRQLWSIIDESYIYPDYNGVDWNAARDETEARINAGLSDEQFYQIMRDLVASLQDDHSYFLSPDEAQEEEQNYAGTGDFVGIGVITDFNPDARRVFVLQVIPDSPAARAGIRAHDHLLKANGLLLVDEDGEPQLSRLRGSEGTTVTVTVRTPGAQPRDVVIQRERVSSASVVEYRIISEKPRIGYILIPTFFEDSIDQQVRSALQALMKTRTRRLDGLIVDMRINGGGAYQILAANLGFYTSGTLGYLVDRKGVQAPLYARAVRIGNSQTVPLIILTGPATQSYAEVFAGALRDHGRARLVGQTTGGNIETLRAHRFDDGSLAWIAEETFRLLDGTNWEGQGLTPDVLVDKNWDEFTVEDDPALKTALKLLSH